MTDSPGKIPHEAQYLHSVFYEQLTEHAFIAELLQEAWYGLGTKVEVLRSEIDIAGYDLVLECDGVVRHVQLKTSRSDARTARQKVNVALAEKPSGCVVWLIRDLEESGRRLRLSYRFFGGAPGEPIPDLDDLPVAKHTKANAEGVKKERPRIRVVSKGRFDVVATTRELLERLFGLEQP